jgi:hypothetical protein
LTGFHHRVVAVVSIKGPRTDCEPFEKACDAKGGAILERPPHPTGPESCLMVAMERASSRCCEDGVGR